MAAELQFVTFTGQLRNKDRRLGSAMVVGINKGNIAMFTTDDLADPTECSVFTNSGAEYVVDSADVEATVDDLVATANYEPAV